MPQTNSRNRQPSLALSGISLDSSSVNRSQYNARRSISVRNSGKLENRLYKAEQSNQTLLDELMRVQNEVRVSTKRYLQKLEDEKQFRKQIESELQRLQSKMAQTEDRLRRSDQIAMDTKNQLSQLVNHAKDVERAVVQQGTASMAAQKDIEKNSQIERILQQLRTELQEQQTKMRQQEVEISLLKNANNQQISSLGSNSESRLSEIEKQVLEESKRRDIAEKKIMEKIGEIAAQIQTIFREREEVTRLLEDKIKIKSSNSNGNWLSREEKLRAEIWQRISDLEKAYQSSANEKLTKNAKDKEVEAVKHATIKDMENKFSKYDEVIKNMTQLQEKFDAMKTEIEEILALEIKNRKENDQMLMKKVNECRDNLHLGMTAIQGKKLTNGVQPNWKLDAVKVHQICQECSDEVRDDLETDIKEVEKSINNLKTEILANKKEFDSRLATIEKMKNVKSDIAAPSMAPKQNFPNDSVAILGSDLDRQLDEMTFFQGRVKSQLELIRNDVETLRDKHVKPLEDNVNVVDRKVTARIDAENRARAKNVEDINKEIEAIKNRPVPKISEPFVKPEEIKKLQDDTSKFQSSIKKLAESVHVVKETLNGKIQEESSVRKEETENLRIGVNKLNQALRSLKDDIKL